MKVILLFVLAFAACVSIEMIDEMCSRFDNKESCLKVSKYLLNQTDTNAVEYNMNNNADMYGSKFSTNSKCSPTQCKIAAATCGATCACDFPACECCVPCLLCLSSLVAQCCDCFLPAEKCPKYINMPINVFRNSSTPSNSNCQPKKCSMRSFGGTCTETICVCDVCPQVITDYCDGYATTFYPVSSYFVPSC